MKVDRAPGAETPNDLKRFQALAGEIRRRGSEYPGEFRLGTSWRLPRHHQAIIAYSPASPLEGETLRLIYSVYASNPNGNGSRVLEDINGLEIVHGDQIIPSALVNKRFFSYTSHKDSSREIEIEIPESGRRRAVDSILTQIEQFVTPESNQRPQFYPLLFGMTDAANSTGSNYLSVEEAGQMLTEAAITQERARWLDKLPKVSL